jgi:hypothetical protein
MTIMTRRRLGTRALGFEDAPWFEEVPAKGRVLPIIGFTAAFAFLLCSACWATGVGLLVASASREGGRVLVCHYLAGKRVVERQYLHPASGSEQHACPLFRAA